jgi:hypothetical protein
VSGTLRGSKPCEKYFELIRTMPTYSTIIVCTECFEVQEAFRKRFGDRVRCYPVSGFGYTSSEYIRNAMIDFVLLSRAKYMVMDGHSHMSLSAGHYGNVYHMFTV